MLLNEYTRLYYDFDKWIKRIWKMIKDSWKVSIKRTYTYKETPRNIKRTFRFYRYYKGVVDDNMKTTKRDVKHLNPKALRGFYIFLRSICTGFYRDVMSTIFFVGGIHYDETSQREYFRPRTCKAA